MDYRPLAEKSDLVVQTTGDETLIYNLKTNKALCLNNTSAAVWNLCNGKLSVLEISDEISKRMKSLIDQDYVWLALEQLGEKGLLTEHDDTHEGFAGLTRREIIRKVGFASAIALPVVSSLVAPKASMAQSLVALGQPCTPGPGVCVAGATCTSTFINAPLGAPTVSSGDRCCTGGGQEAPGSFFCTGGGTCASVAGVCCSGSISTVGDNPLCAPGGSNTTCQCD